MSKKLSVKASAVKAAARGRPIQVVAAYDRDILTATSGVTELARLSYREHACSDCGTVMSVSTEVAQPLCVTCGSAHVTAGAKSANAFKRDEDLVAVTCSHCSTPNVMDVRVVKASNYQVHCISCGEAIHADATDADLTDGASNPGATNTMRDPAGLGNTPLSKPPAAKAVADFDSLDDDEVSLDDGDDDLLESSMLGETDMSLPPPVSYELDPLDARGMENDDQVHNELRVSSPTDVDMRESLGIEDLGLIEDPVVDMPLIDGELASRSSSSTDEGDAEDGEDTEPGPETAGEILMDAADVIDDAAELSFVRAGNRLVALKGHVSVASLTRKAAGDNRDLMFTDTFAQAVTATAQRQGLRSALSAFKFEPVRAGNVQKAALDRRVNAMKELAAADQRKRSAERAEVMALAAAGLARNFWKGHKDPIGASLIDFLAAQGVRRPEVTASRIMRSAGMQYAEELMKVVARLETMSAAARKEFADALNLTQDPGEEYDATSMEDQVDADSIDEDYTVDDLDSVVSASALTSRLSSPGRVTSRATPALLQPKRGLNISASAQDVLTGKSGLGFSGF